MLSTTTELTTKPGANEKGPVGITLVRSSALLNSTAPAPLILSYCEVVTSPDTGAASKHVEV
ncbi:unannotated protein [freshwater metagenome]|uniref:Unannotated protein n=1 Tax=freshwater metagenome TaxID=449393 RepID=A0A6J7U5N3_9ZZZZ